MVKVEGKSTQIYIFMFFGPLKNRISDHDQPVKNRKFGV